MNLMRMLLINLVYLCKEYLFSHGSPDFQGPQPHSVYRQPYAQPRSRVSFLLRNREDIPLSTALAAYPSQTDRRSSDKRTNVNDPDPEVSASAMYQPLGHICTRNPLIYRPAVYTSQVVCNAFR